MAIGKQRKVLLVGSSYSAAPIFFALKRYGLHVSVCGKLKSDPCHQFSDASFYVDYSKWKDLNQIVESEKFDYLVPTCNDYSYMACVPIAEKHGFYGFDRPEVAAFLHTKNEFRRSSARYGLRAPRYISLTEGEVVELQGLQPPLLVKPVDSFSGRGMTKVVDSAQLSQAIKYAVQESRSRKVVVEEFVGGDLHSHSAFIQDGRVALDFFVDEFCTVYPYQVDCSNHPSSLAERIRDAVRMEINKLAGAADLNDGLLHTQFITNGDQYWIIECMRRCPGDLYGTLISLSTGIDYEDLFVRPFLNLRLADELPKQRKKFFGRHTISIDKALINFSFSQSIPAKSVEIVALKKSGEELGAAPFDKLAILFAEFSDEQTMLQVTPRFSDFVHIKALEEG